MLRVISVDFSDGFNLVKGIFFHNYNIPLGCSLKSNLSMVTVSNGRVHFIQTKFSVTSGPLENPLNKMSLSPCHSQLVSPIILLRR